MTAFPIHPTSRFAGSSAAIRRPGVPSFPYISSPLTELIAYQEITCFSYDGARTFHPDVSSLRYYYPPRLGADLCQGFDTFRKVDDTRDEHLDGLCQSIEELERRTGERVEVDIVTWRGMMTKQTSRFIEESRAYKIQEREAQNRQPNRGGPSQEMMSYWGYKFETLCLIPRPWNETSREEIEGREEEVVDNHAQFISVVRTGIGSTSLLLGGEVDAVWDIHPPTSSSSSPTSAQRSTPYKPINYIELKTSLSLSPAPQSTHRFTQKLLKTWIQSFLLGVPKVIYGFRSREGRLESLREFETQGIPAEVKRNTPRRGAGDHGGGGGAVWDGNTCINFGAAVLEFLKSNLLPPDVPRATEGGVFLIRRPPRSPTIEVSQIEDTGFGDILTPEFVRWRKELA
ncbi:MAG: decapping endonuclease targeting mRNA [Caeruleum heppii]|nr:MAG: decapping endonuclease targeting mRNA [Caeruleum heppii]